MAIMRTPGANRPTNRQHEMYSAPGTMLPGSFTFGSITAANARRPGQATSTSASMVSTSPTQKSAPGGRAGERAATTLYACAVALAYGTTGRVPVGGVPAQAACASPGTYGKDGGGGIRPACTVVPWNSSPQLAQNLAPTVTSLPHLGHCVTNSLTPRYVT